MLRQTILVGLLSAFGVVGSAGSALAQTVGTVGFTFTGNVGLACEFQNNTSGATITTASGTMTYNTSGELRGSTTVRLNCTSPRAELKWTDIDAKKDGAALPSGIIATLSTTTAGTARTSEPLPSGGIRTSPSRSYSITSTVSNPSSPNDGLPEGAYEVTGTLTATPL